MAANSGPMRVHIWTDGSVLPSNPGECGGWGAILVGRNGKGEERMRAVSGYIPKPATYNDDEGGVTCNRAEAMAALRALSFVKFKGSFVSITTDSMYVVRGLNRIIKKRNILDTHTDLWSSAQTIVHFQNIKVSVAHVDGHDADVMNEWADELAKEAARTGTGVDEIHTSAPQHLVDRVRKRVARRKS